MMDFREVLSYSDLYDLGFSGLPWTYNNNQRGTRNVRVRLDRGVANSDWMLMWPITNVIHHTSPQSDHKALLVKVRSGSETLHQHRIFRYQIMWEREETLSSVVEKEWQRKNPGSDLGALAERLQVVTKDLKAWSRSNFWQITKQLEELCDEVVSLERNDPIRNWDTILTTKKKLDELLYREEMMWLQPSRVNLLKDGDRNTKYFHQRARWRARKNRIKKLKKQDGNWMSDQEEMQNMATDYFANLFMEDASVNPQGVVNLFSLIITKEMNYGLIKPYSAEEISDTLFQIGPLKAPGPDGFPAHFFQRSWPVMKEDIIRATQEFFETGIMKEGVNDTCLVLIPKVPFSETLKDFRPISLCNVIYKVVSKCIVNRLSLCWMVLSRQTKVLLSRGDSSQTMH
jgi:hypothetical protein